MKITDLSPVGQEIVKEVHNDSKTIKKILMLVSSFKDVAYIIKRELMKQKDDSHQKGGNLEFIGKAATLHLSGEHYGQYNQYRNAANVDQHLYRSQEVGAEREVDAGYGEKAQNQR